MLLIQQNLTITEANKHKLSVALQAQHKITGVNK